jgi:hypothetical protein
VRSYHSALVFFLNISFVINLFFNRFITVSVLRSRVVHVFCNVRFLRIVLFVFDFSRYYF